MDTISATDASSRLHSLIDETASSHTPVTITGTNGNAVLISAEDWSAVQETLFLLSIPGMRESIRAGMAEPLEDSSEELSW
jgi:antitoxin YefM